MQFRTKAGETLEIALPDPDTEHSVFAFSLHKAGSVLLDRVVEGLATAAGRPSFSLTNVAFTRGISLEQLDDQDVRGLFKRPGYVFFGFRHKPRQIHDQDLSAKRKILLVRDPRDMLVSYYFSVAQSHPLPKEGWTREQIVSQRKIAKSLDINEFVISDATKHIAKNYDAYVAFDNATDNLRVYRYEDIIFSKRPWVRNIAEDLELEVLPSEADAIADKHDILPDQERPDQHVRWARPGNHLKYLNPNVIDEINTLYCKPMRRFGYG